MLVGQGDGGVRSCPACSRPVWLPAVRVAQNPGQVGPEAVWGRATGVGVDVEVEGGQGVKGGVPAGDEAGYGHPKPPDRLATSGVPSSSHWRARAASNAINALDSNDAPPGAPGRRRST